MNIKGGAIGVLFGLLLALGLGHSASAQTVVKPCVQIQNSVNGVTTYSCPNVTSTYPLPIYQAAPLSGKSATAAFTATTAASTLLNVPGLGQWYISGIQVSNSSNLSSIAEVVAGPANTILWQGDVANNAPNNPNLNIPIAAGAGLSVGCLFTVAVTTGFCNLQAYQGP